MFVTKNRIFGQNLDFLMSNIRSIFLDRDLKWALIVIFTHYFVNDNVQVAYELRAG